MSQLLIEANTDDAEWLKDTKGIDLVSPAVAVLYGNEDWPDEIRIYSSNNVNAVVAVFTPDTFSKSNPG